MSLACVKYLLSKRAKPEMSAFGYIPIGKFGDVTLLKNKYSLPLGITYDKFIYIEDFRKLDQLQKDLMLLQAFITDKGNDGKSFGIENPEGNYTQLTYKDTTPDYVLNPFKYCENFTDSLKSNKLEITTLSQNLIAGEIELKKAKMLFFAIPYDVAWQAEVDGKSADLKLVSAGFLGLQLKAGKHKVKLQFRPLFLTQGIIVAILAFIIYMLIIYNYIMKKRRNSVKD